jgi:hypothetical protein
VTDPGALHRVDPERETQGTPERSSNPGVFPRTSLHRPERLSGTVAMKPHLACVDSSRRVDTAWVSSGLHVRLQTAIANVARLACERRDLTGRPPRANHPRSCPRSSAGRGEISGTRRKSVFVKLLVDGKKREPA